MQVHTHSHLLYGRPRHRGAAETLRGLYTGVPRGALIGFSVHVDEGQVPLRFVVWLRRIRHREHDFLWLHGHLGLRGTLTPNSGDHLGVHSDVCIPTLYKRVW